MDTQQPYPPPQPPYPPPGPPAPIQPPQAVIEAGRAMSYLSYASMFVGLPLFIIPMIQRDNAFALYHARQAGAAFVVSFLLGMIVAGITLVTCGFGMILIPVVMLPLVSAVHGLILTSNGEYREPVLIFGLGDKLFGGLQPK